MNESTNRTGYKWLALALLWVAFFLQQGTRQVFSATLSSIQASLGVTAAQIGLVATVFTFAYGLSVPFAGVAADLLNRKWMVVSGVFVFCLGIFASGFVAALGLLIVTYGLLNGFGQSFYYPSATSIIGQLHKETRATALSILQMGLYTGIVGCSAAAGFLAESGADGWRTAFRIFGGIGILWAVALAFLLRDTRPDGGVAAAAPESDAPARKPALKEAFAVAAKRPSVRMETNMLGLACAVPFIAWMAYAPSLTACCVAMALFGVFRGVYDSNLMASLFDLIPSRYHASGAGIMLCFGFVFGSTSPVVLGLLKEHFSSAAGIASLAAFYLAGAAVIAAARWRAFRR